MTKVSNKTTCNKCNNVIYESPNLLAAERSPCPKCGSISRAFEINVSETIKTYDFLKLNHKEPGRKKPVSEITSGHDLHRDSGKWMFLERIIDRGKNWYKEIITDIETKKIIRHVEHPLDQHVGHGSAKLNKNKPL